MSPDIPSHMAFLPTIIPLFYVSYASTVQSVGPTVGLLFSCPYNQSHLLQIRGFLDELIQLKAMRPRNLVLKPDFEDFYKRTELSNLVSSVASLSPIAEYMGSSMPSVVGHLAN